MADPIGVPLGEATAKDFMMVRAALVQRLGGANEALVWARIFYRADEDSRAAHEVDGSLWWRAPHPLIAKETGLSEKQVRSAVEALVDGGFVERQKHAGNVYSYRAVVYLPSGADTVSALQGRSNRPVGQIVLPSGAGVPLIETEDLKDTPVAPKGAAVDPRIVDAFERAWKAWIPSRAGSRKKAESSFRTAAKTVGVNQLERLVLTIQAHCDAWRSWVPADHQFVPMMATWLNQERWTTPVPERDRGRQRGSVEHGRHVDEILRAREASQLAVTS